MIMAKLPIKCPSVTRAKDISIPNEARARHFSRMHGFSIAFLHYTYRSQAINTAAERDAFQGLYVPALLLFSGDTITPLSFRCA